MQIEQNVHKHTRDLFWWAQACKNQPRPPQQGGMGDISPPCGASLTEGVPARVVHVEKPCSLLHVLEHEASCEFTFEVVVRFVVPTSVEHRLRLARPDQAWSDFDHIWGRRGGGRRARGGVGGRLEICSEIGVRSSDLDEHWLRRFS